MKNPSIRSDTAVNGLLHGLVDLDKDLGLGSGQLVGCRSQFLLSLCKTVFDEATVELVDGNELFRNHLYRSVLVDGDGSG